MRKRSCDHAIIWLQSPFFAPETAIWWPSVGPNFLFQNLFVFGGRVLDIRRLIRISMVVFEISKSNYLSGPVWGRRCGSSSPKCRMLCRRLSNRDTDVPAGAYLKTTDGDANEAPTVSPAQTAIVTVLRKQDCCSLDASGSSVVAAGGPEVHQPLHQARHAIPAAPPQQPARGAPFDSMTGDLPAAAEDGEKHLTEPARTATEMQRRRRPLRLRGRTTGTLPRATHTSLPHRSGPTNKRSMVLCRRPEPTY
jgi:hypothetical protein